MCHSLLGAVAEQLGGASVIQSRGSDNGVAGVGRRVHGIAWGVVRRPRAVGRGEPVVGAALSPSCVRSWRQVVAVVMGRGRRRQPRRVILTAGSGWFVQEGTLVTLIRR